MAKRQTHRNARTIHRRALRHIKLAVVPHAANQFRPHLIRVGGLAVLLLLVFALQLGYNWSKTGFVLGVEATVTSNELLQETNIERQRGGIQPLNYSEQLSGAAFLKAQDMFRQQYWSHTAPDGATPWQWLAKANYNYAYAGENLAKNFTTAAATTTAWMGSLEHRSNLLSSHYSEVGFAVVDGTLQGKRTKLIVALFASPATTAGVAGATTRTATPVGSLSPIAQFGVALQSITPAALGSVILLLAGAVVALAAHAYRRQLPMALRRSWRYHHGLIKAVGLTTLALVVIALYSGGQI